MKSVNNNKSTEHVNVSFDSSNSSEKITKTLSKSKMTTTAGTGMAVVGGGLVAWQVYSITANQNDAPTHEVKIPKKKPIFSDKPEYLDLPTNYVHLDPSRDAVKAKGELRSMLHRRPWKLLRAANSDSKEQHINAVRDLSKLSSNLSDGEMRQMAQASNFQTAVGLASRFSVDPRFFTPPPPAPSIVEESSIPMLFKDILTMLPTAGIHNCIKLFTDNALHNYVAPADEDAIRDRDLEYEFQRDTHLIYNPPRKQNYTKNSVGEKLFLENCLQALLSHSTLEEHCEKMIDTTMLPLLIRIIKSEHGSNPQIKSLIGKIVANMAMFPATHMALFKAGFVGILAQWKDDPNLLVTLPATRALANLDSRYGPKYAPGVYLMLNDANLKPGQSIEKSKGVDVVFLHGLLGGAFYTWRQEDAGNTRGWGRADLVSSDDYSYCWPRDWFKEDQMDEQGVRVIGVDFDTYLSQWGNSCPKENFKTTLNERSTEILSKLKESGIGKRPVIFVGHSMGGLIIKRMLAESEQTNNDDLIKNTKGVVFYSTPHKGSQVAKLNAGSKLLFFPSTEVQDLEANSPALNELHQSFLDLAKRIKMKVVSFGETVPTPYMGLDITFVPGESSDPGYGEHYKVGLNHMNICKPNSKGSKLYRKLINIVWDELDNVNDPFEQ